MESIQKVTYFYFWLMIPVFLLLIIRFQKNEVDIQIHDTYYVFGLTRIWTLVVLLFSFHGLVYWAFRNIKLIEWITYVHVVISVLFAAQLAFFCDYIYYNFEQPQILISFASVLFLIAEVLFIQNIAIALILRIPKNE